MNGFASILAGHGLRLERAAPRVLQLNLGRVCNSTCIHCHVSAGPSRTETMSAPVAAKCLEWIRKHRPPVVDLTGGAPELCASFRDLASGARESGARVIDRSNLTVFFEPGQEDLAEFLRDHRVEVIASLPCYLAENVDAQRGAGVFARSIQALRALNSLGYGIDSLLGLDLVYNPAGASLPPEQKSLEQDYRRMLRERYGVVFRRLLCLANMPVGRFAAWLQAEKQADAYDRLLVDHFNPETVEGLMCRDTISVGWEGDLFDCDFNQMLGMRMGGAPRRYLWEVDPADLPGRPIATAPHCFGCTAGHGSSCGGSLA